MKRLFPFFLLILIIGSNLAVAQQTNAASTQAPYLRFPNIPPFNLLKIDSATYLTKENLRKHHPTLIMFFSPTCDHCKHQTRDILGSIEKFKDIEIVMATYQPFDEMRDFYNSFHIGNYPNIKMGRDEKFVLPPFYKIANLPFLALYDKKGNLITTFEGNQKVDTILNAFSKKQE